MKKIAILFVCLLLIGCSSIEGMVYLNEAVYTESEDVAVLLSQLPGNKHLVGYEFEDSRLSINYQSNHEEKDDLYWEDDEAYKTFCLMNASVVFEQYEELDKIMIYLNTKGYIYSLYFIREDIEAVYGQMDIKNNFDTFKKTVSVKDKLDKYYSMHSPLIMENAEDC